MELIRWALIAYLVIINLTAYIVYRRDKVLAREHRWRVPEKTLLTLSALGGSLGSLLAMHDAHHKTSKLRFAIGVPAMLIGHLAVFGYIFWLIS